MEPRLGVVGTGGLVTRGLHVEFAQRAEELGYDTLWMGENWGWEIFGSVAQIACHTSRIELGTAVVSVYSRTPALVAQGIATADAISGGRVILGLGASSEKVVEDWHGLRFEKPLERTREYIEIIRLALSGERVNFQGRFFRMKGFRLQAQPAQRRISIYLGALGPRNLELLGELCDGWVPSFIHFKYLDDFKARMESGARRTGRSMEDVVLAPWILTCVSKDGAAAKKMARAHLGFWLGGYGHFYNDLVRRYGFVEEAERTQQLFAKDHRSAAAGVSDAMLDALAIAGTPEECRERFFQLREELQALGVRAPAVMPPYSVPLDVVWETVQSLAPSRFRA